MGFGCGFIGTGEEPFFANAISSGETNTASNLGAGEGVFGAKVGVDLQFKSFTVDNGLLISSTADEIDIRMPGANTDFYTLYWHDTDGEWKPNGTLQIDPSTDRVGIGNITAGVLSSPTALKITPAGSDSGITITDSATYAISATQSAVGSGPRLLNLSSDNAFYSGWPILYNNQQLTENAAIAEFAIKYDGTIISDTLTASAAHPGSYLALYVDPSNGEIYANSDTPESAGGDTNQNAFSNITDGTNTAAADSETDTFKIHSANSLLDITVTNDDATHGDSVLFTVDNDLANYDNTNSNFISETGTAAGNMLFWDGANFVETSAIQVDSVTPDIEINSYGLRVETPPSTGFYINKTSGTGNGIYVNQTAGSDPLILNAGATTRYASFIDNGTGSTEIRFDKGGMIYTVGDIVIDNASSLILSELDSNGSDNIEIKAPDSVTTSYTINLPPAQGAADQILQNDGAGNLSWVDSSAVGGGDTNQNAFSNITDGTNTAAADSETDTFKLLTANSLLDIVVTNDDATHGDSVLFTVDNDLANYDNTTSAFVASGDNVSVLVNDAGYLTDITGENLGDLSDVNLTTPADNSILSYDTGTGTWIDQTAADLGLASADVLSIDDQPGEETTSSSYVDVGTKTITLEAGKKYLLVATGQHNTNSTNVTNERPEFIVHISGITGSVISRGVNANFGLDGTNSDINPYSDGHNTNFIKISDIFYDTQVTVANGGFHSTWIVDLTNVTGTPVLTPRHRVLSGNGVQKSRVDSYVITLIEVTG